MAKNQYIPTIVFHPADTLREKLEEMGIAFPRWGSVPG